MARITTVPSTLPYRGRFGDPRPDGLAALRLPPDRMPSHYGTRALKTWRYVGAYGSELMLCVGAVRIGPARQAFWAVWDRGRGRLHERTTLGRGRVAMTAGAVRISEPDLRLVLDFAETGGIETVCRAGDAYAWTRKQIVDYRAWLWLGGESHRWLGSALIDDTAAYYPRHTSWCWSAGVGMTADGRHAAWNLVNGVNDPETNSERTIWIDREPKEAPPSTFAADLSRVDDLLFAPEAVRARDENLLLIRSSYRQPFGTFSGTLPDGTPLAEGFGVMESHDVRW